MVTVAVDIVCWSYELWSLWFGICTVQEKQRFLVNLALKAPRKGVNFARTAALSSGAFESGSRRSRSKTSST